MENLSSFLFFIKIKILKYFQSATKDIENSPAKSPFGDFKLKKVKPVELKPIDEFKLETVELKHHDKETLPQVEEVTLK